MATKKPVAKKTPAKKASAKKPAAKTRAKRVSAAVPQKAMKRSLTATDLLNKACEEAGIERKQGKAFMDVLQRYVTACLMKGGVGSAKVLGWNFKSRLKPAVKGGKKAISPFTKEEYITKSKPASIRAKAMPLKAVKDCLAI